MEKKKKKKKKYVIREQFLDTGGYRFHAYEVSESGEWSIATTGADSAEECEKQLRKFISTKPSIIVKELEL